MVVRGRLVARITIAIMIALGMLVRSEAKSGSCVLCDFCSGEHCCISSSSGVQNCVEGNDFCVEYGGGCL
jgi:hypothetical protein